MAPAPSFTLDHAASSFVKYCRFSQILQR